MPIELTSQYLSLDEFEILLNTKETLVLSQELKERIQTCRAYLDRKIETAEHLIYGVNTGFGSLCDTAISTTDLEALQRNLVCSHACGIGEEVPQEIVRRMLLLKVLGLSKGASGVQLATIERLLFFFNECIYPVVYQQGSLGASGDLAPLPQLAAASRSLGRIAMLLVAGMLRHVFSLSGIDTLAEGLVSGLGVGLFFISPWVMINNAYGMRPFKLTLIDGGYATFGCAIMGGVLMLV